MRARRSFRTTESISFPTPASWTGAGESSTREAISPTTTRSGSRRCWRRALPARRLVLATSPGLPALLSPPAQGGGRPAAAPGADYDPGVPTAESILGHSPGSGYGKSVPVLVYSHRQMISADTDGRKRWIAGHFSGKERLRIGGFLRPESRDALTGGAWLVEEAVEAGGVVLFSEDPNF